MSEAGVHLVDAIGPDGLRIYAVGDIHGRLDLLTKMHEAITTHLAEQAVGDWRIVHLGDYVDRGPDSRGVVDFLIAAQTRDTRIVSLAGNHDVGFLDFLREPDPNGLFANNGGRETAFSYGVTLDFADPVSFPTRYAAFRQAVPQTHRSFIESLRFSIAFGDFFFCHAGIQPGIPLESQEPRDLLWIREKFLHYEGLHPKIIVHGHTPSVEPEVRANRVNIDTGAFRTAVLTALVVEGKDKQILQVIG
jgi:serine/threonine protein phosphatase 1